MFAIVKLHHVAIPARDLEATRAFYETVLGLERHTEKSNWLKAGDGFNVHLMPTSSAPGPDRVERHFALQVDSLESLTAHLLALGLEPYQESLEGEVHLIRDTADPLTFGLGSVFITDPENNVVEFLQKDKGLFALITS